MKPRPMGYLDRRIREQLQSYVANEPELKRARSFHGLVSTFDSMLRSFRDVRAFCPKCPLRGSTRTLRRSGE